MDWLSERQLAGAVLDALTASICVVDHNGGKGAFVLRPIDDRSWYLQMTAKDVRLQQSGNF